MAVDLSAKSIAVALSTVTALTGYTWLRSKTSGSLSVLPTVCFLLPIKITDISGDFVAMKNLIRLAGEMKKFHAANKLVPDWWEVLFFKRQLHQIITLAFLFTGSLPA